MNIKEGMEFCDSYKCGLNTIPFTHSGIFHTKKYTDWTKQKLNCYMSTATS